MPHYIAIVDYLGINFAGWQQQVHADAVENHLIRALGLVANQPVDLVCAGRTDAGVHALYQVISFSLDTVRTTQQLLRGTNSHLPDAIRVQSVVELDEKMCPPVMNARFDAVFREYVYIIDTRPVASAFLHGLVWHLPQHLDEHTMDRAAQLLLGEQDFQAFRAAGCQSHSSMRDIMCARVWRQGYLVCVQLRANAFLYHMVRNIVGSLVQVGLGARSPEWIAELLVMRDRTQAAPTAPAAGLYLRYVKYPSYLQLPPAPPHFLLGERG